MELTHEEKQAFAKKEMELSSEKEKRSIDETADAEADAPVSSL
jgi:homocitrate synthase